MVSRLIKFDAAFSGSASHKKCRILYLENTESLEPILRGSLGEKNFELIPAENLSDTLMRLCLERIDVVLVDLEGVEGREFHGVVQIKEVNPLVPVILLTPSLSKGDLERLRSVTVILEKPVNLELLTAVFERLAQEPLQARLHRLSSQRPILLPADVD